MGDIGSAQDLINLRYSNQDRFYQEMDRNKEKPFGSLYRQDRFTFNHGMSKDMSITRDYDHQETYYYQDAMFSNQESFQHDLNMYNQDGPSDRMYEEQHEAYF